MKIMKPIFNGIILVMIILCVFACSGKNQVDDTEVEEKIMNPSNDMQAISKMFPSLEGATESQWEQIKLGSDDESIPGPNDYKYQGYIVLSEDAAKNYAESYDWKEVKPDVNFESIEVREGNWKYSYDFCMDYIPKYYAGEVWIDGNTILFSITTK